MIPVWRYWVALLITPFTVSGWTLLVDSPWKYAVVFAHGVIFAALLHKYRKKLVEVER